MTKAERIYKATRYECKRSWETFGYSECKNGKAVGFNMVHHEDDESICTRTLNEVATFLRSAYKMLEMDKMLKIVNKDQYMKELQILKMVESTIENSREHIANW